MKVSQNKSFFQFKNFGQDLSTCKGETGVIPSIGPVHLFNMKGYKDGSITKQKQEHVAYTVAGRDCKAPVRPEVRGYEVYSRTGPIGQQRRDERDFAKRNGMYLSHIFGARAE